MTVWNQWEHDEEILQSEGEDDPVYKQAQADIGCLLLVGAVIFAVIFIGIALALYGLAIWISALQQGMIGA